MELFFDITFLSILNLHTVDWGTDFQSVMTSNIVSLVFITLFCAVQVYFITAYFIMPKENRVEAFANKFDPLLDGTTFERKSSNVISKGHLILVPVFFFTKRLLFVSILIFANSYLWVQVSLLNAMAIATIIFTLWFMPLDSKGANYIEVLNEVTLLLLTYHLWCFTDFVGEPETRNYLGFAFIATTQSNILVHLILMIIETVHHLKLRCKRR